MLYETQDQPSPLIVAQGTADPEFQRIITFDYAGSLYKEDFSPLQKVDKTLRNIEARTKVFGEVLEVEKHPYLVPTFNDIERQAILETLGKENLIERVRASHEAIISIRMTQEGLKRAGELKTCPTTGSTVFIAACFRPELEEARAAISETIKSLGYDPYLVNQDPHNDLIDLRIYDHIRQSRFMVADLTYNRQSVYYEIGFAHGLGLEVILTCREDHFKGADDESKRVHFDLEHRGILIWANEGELGEKIEKHILQSFGRLPESS